MILWTLAQTRLVSLDNFSVLLLWFDIILSTSNSISFAWETIISACRQHEQSMRFWWSGSKFWFWSLWDLCLNQETVGYCDEEKLCSYFRTYFHSFNEPIDSIWVHWVDRCCLPNSTVSLAHGKHPLVTPTNIILNLFFVKRYFWFNCPLKKIKINCDAFDFPIFWLFVRSQKLWIHPFSSISLMKYYPYFHFGLVSFLDFLPLILQRHVPLYSFCNFLFFFTWLWVFSWFLIRF